MHVRGHDANMMPGAKFYEEDRSDDQSSHPDSVIPQVDSFEHVIKSSLNL